MRMKTTYRTTKCHPSNGLLRGAAAKLRSNAGETISEVLVGVLIVGLATVLFAGMVGAATSIASQSTEALQASYQETSSVDAATASSGTPTVTVTGGGFTWNAKTTLYNSTAESGDSPAFSRYELEKD